MGGIYYACTLNVMTIPLTLKSTLFTAFLLLAFFLAGCGQKGPLYLPDPDEKQKQESSER